MHTMFSSPQKMWVFDIDGVLTDPEEKKITRPEIFIELIKRLKQNEPIGLNTGRSLAFIEQEILTPLRKVIDTPELLRLLFPVGEYGGVWMTYEKNGTFRTYIDSTISFPTDIQQKITNIVKEQFTDIVFVDPDKKTMMSLELCKGKTVHDFQKITPVLLSLIDAILKQSQIQNAWSVHVTRICIDIQLSHFGKHHGMKKLFELIQQSRIDPKEYLTFGDSASDYAMHEAIEKTGKPSHFVFVGEPEQLQGKDIQNCEFPSRHCDAGTLEYLQTH